MAACRAARFAALVPQPDELHKAKKRQAFIANLANWDNSIDADAPHRIDPDQIKLTINETFKQLRLAPDYQ